MEIYMLSNNTNTNNSRKQMNRASSPVEAIKKPSNNYKKNNLNSFHSSLLFSSPSSSSSSSLSRRKFKIPFDLISYLIILLVLNHVIVKPLEAVNQIGCLIDANVCEYDEFCFDDSVLGICLDNNIENFDNPVSETLRSEQETPLYLNSPIRIHKYDIESGDEDDDDDDDENENENENEKNSNDFLNYIQKFNIEASTNDDNNDDDDNDNQIGNENNAEYLKNTYNLNNELDDSVDDSVLNRFNAELAADAAAAAAAAAEEDEDDDDNHSNENYFNNNNDNGENLLNEIRIMKKYSPDDDDSEEAFIEKTANNFDELERLLESGDLKSDRLRLSENEEESLKDIENKIEDLIENELTANDRKKFVAKRSLMSLLKDYNSEEEEEDSDEEADRLLDRVNHDLYEDNLINRAVQLLDEDENGNGGDDQFVESADSQETEILKKRAIRLDQKDYLNDNDDENDDDYDRSMLSYDLDEDSTPESDQIQNYKIFRIINSKINKNSNSILEDATAAAVAAAAAADNRKKMLNNYSTTSIHDSYVFLETNKKLNEDEREEFINYILTQLSIPANSIENIIGKNNFILFTLNSSDLTSNYEKLADKLGKIANNHENQFKYLDDKGIKIVRFGIENQNLKIKAKNFEKHFYNQQEEEKKEKEAKENEEKDEAAVTPAHRLLFRHPFNIDPNSKQFFQLTILTCTILSALLLLLLAVFVFKRRRYLSGKLIKDVKNPVYRINFEDDESLISSRQESRATSAWRSLVEFFKCSMGRFRKSNNGSQTTTSASSSQLVTSQDYQDLCRQRMQSKAAAGATTTVGVKNETNGKNSGNVSPTLSIDKYTFNAAGDGGKGSGQNSPRSSSTSSWNEEPIKSFNIDITTGHIILTYMEEHLNDKNKLHDEWNGLCNYEPEPNSTEIGNLPENITKNRYSNILPYDHTRVKLKNKENDYINANYIIDDDPKNPSYIAAQGPLMHTTNDFWHMVWQEESVVIVSLCRTIEYGSAKCHQFWPANGFCVYDKFEIHLVSEHVWCEDFLVRNFFLKNLELNQTRTVTQFHYLTWSENGVPQNIKSFLDFRRKVNKSFKAKSSPLIVHCNDGVARTGTYVLIDMVLNKIAKGSKEIDISATLEYLRDQRPGMIKNKIQFEYSFAVITEELHNMLKALRQ